MRTIAHLSDTHFGTVDDSVRRALIRDLHARPVDLIILTGDITQRARSWQFRQARAFLAELPPVPRLAIPGNHDIPLFDVITRFIHPYRLHRRYICAELEPVFTDEQVAVLCVNATRRTRHINGVISSGQIERVARSLERLCQPFKLIATHQPLAVTLPIDVENLARGARRALDHWIEAGADLFLGGHIHLPYCVCVRGGSAGRRAIVLQAGTATSRRIRHGVPNSYNRISLECTGSGRSMHLSRWDFDAATQSFTAEHRYDITAAPHGWSIQ